MRRLAKIAAACALLLAFWAPAPPASAQFFPFFDNRPRAAPPPRREIRRKPKKQHAKPARENRRPAAAAPKAEPKPVEEGPPPPYEPQLLRLSEIMGALSVLDPLCEGRADKDGGWRQSMEKLLDAQEPGPRLRERLAGAYNRGLTGYNYFHRQCTPASGLARSRLLEEGGRLAHDITSTYREK